MMRTLLKIPNASFCSTNYVLTMIRHGQSIWNKEKKWAGWIDVPLSSYGIKQVKQCSKLLKNKGINYDVVYTSVLMRSIKSANYILDELDIMYIPMHKQWRLNEKHYGSLQGCSKVQVKQKHGDQIVTKWRRSMNVPPPPLDKNHETHPLNNPRYKDIDRNLIPDSQSLSHIIKRVRVLWDEKISKDIRQKKNVLVVAHGSSLRALVSIMNPKMNEQDLKNFNIPNATPIIVNLDSNLIAIKNQYLGDQNQIAMKMNKIKHQTQRKEI